MKGIQDRKELTDVWRENGITEGKEYAILTNEIYKEWSGMTAQEYKEYKGLRKESLRDNMDSIEVAKLGGHAAKVAREDIEKNLGEKVITKDNRLNYQYKDEKLIENK